jgi:hypothetical protein
MKTITPKMTVVSMLFLMMNISQLKAQDTINTSNNQVDSILNDINSNREFNPNDKLYQFKSKKLIVPAALITVGSLSLAIPALDNINKSTRNEILEDKSKGTHLDNYTQYLPAAAVYGLNLAGVEGKHNFRDRSIIFATSQIITMGFVLPLKHIVKEQRPDESNNLSFPSGHTANAFSTAQFMFREYQDTNIWLSLAGYPIAAFTGIYRVVNNKHWVGDVVAGAGIGILSTEAAYWLFPTINKWFSPKNKESKVATMVFPTFQNKQAGLGLVMRF